MLEVSEEVRSSRTERASTGRSLRPVLRPRGAEVVHDGGRDADRTVGSTDSLEPPRERLPDLRPPRPELRVPHGEKVVDDGPRPDAEHPESLDLRWFRVELKVQPEQDGAGQQSNRITDIALMMSNDAM